MAAVSRPGHVGKTVQCHEIISINCQCMKILCEKLAGEGRRKKGEKFSLDRASSYEKISSLLRDKMKSFDGVWEAFL